MEGAYSIQVNATIQTHQQNRGIRETLADTSHITFYRDVVRIITLGRYGVSTKYVNYLV
jgi:hypothetical protein